MNAWDEISEAIIRRNAEEATRPNSGKRVRCLKCLVEIQSMFLHDYQSCRCGDIAIDGGGDYQKMCVMPGGGWCYVDDEPDGAA